MENQQSFAENRSDASIRDGRRKSHRTSFAGVGKRSDSTCMAVCFVFVIDYITKIM
jgi:hypothetical protein